MKPISVVQNNVVAVLFAPLIKDSVKEKKVHRQIQILPATCRQDCSSLFFFEKVL